MSQFTVNLNEPEKPEPSPPMVETNFNVNKNQSPQKRGGCARILKISGLFLLVLVIVGGIGGYFYWQSVKASPKYSIALLVDAARRNDQPAIDELIDMDATVNSFIPQVSAKAIELYGKNLPPDKIAKVQDAASPLQGIIVKRAREEVPRIIQEKADKFVSVPFWAIALGAGWFLDFKINGDTAIVTSQISQRPFELTMIRNGDKWKVTGIKDDALALYFAQKIGQELIAISTKDSINSTKESIKKSSEDIDSKDVDKMKKKLNDIFK